VGALTPGLRAQSAGCPAFRLSVWSSRDWRLSKVMAIRGGIQDAYGA